jgi:pimeloyl-ACP methyl ester carboxylesterase
MLLTEPNHQFNELKKIQCPVLVMAGEKDVIKINHTKGIAENILKSTLLIAPKESHFFPVENPKDFNEIVLNFLKGGKVK